MIFFLKTRKKIIKRIPFFFFKQVKFAYNFFLSPKTKENKF